MKLIEKFTDSLDSLYLAMFMVWTVMVAVALIQPEIQHEPEGAVEIYALVPASDLA